MVGELEFRVLGALAAVRDGRVLELRSRGQRAVLAALLQRANQPTGHDLLAEAVWEGRPPTRSVDVLRVHVSQLRKLLGRQAIVTLPGGYLLRLDAHRVDAHRFERGVRRGERALDEGDPPAAERALTGALELWRGPPYEDVRYRGFFQPEIRRLEELYVTALERRADALLQVGRHEELTIELAALVEEHPERERLWGALMLALYRSGRQADALAAFRRARRTLVEEQGLEPGRELRELERRILRQERELELGEHEVRLPSQLTSFVGRERELAETAAVLADRRLVMLVGAGGSGKTRLAIETARRAASGFVDGVWFVDLSAVRGGESLAATVRTALGLTRATPALDLEALVSELEARQVLLVLDNCEHVVEQAAGLVSALLSRCAGLRVLATSRERLGIPGELVYQVPTLSLPESALDGDGDGDAVALFVARAREVLPGFAVDASTRSAAVAIVQALDGIPLAIELAAARLAALPLDRLADTIAAAMPELGSGSRVALPRHATLRAAFAWSVELLAPAERDLFERLWVFRGGWTLETLAQLEGRPSDELLAPLSRLVEVSLVELDRRGAAVRYRLLEPVRQYARSLVDDRCAAELRTAHARLYAEAAREAAELFDGTDPRALDLYAAEEANLVAALEEKLRTGTREDAARIATSLGTYWSHVGRYARADDWLGRTLGASGGLPAELEADLLAIAGRAATLAGRCRDAAALLLRAERLLRESGDHARQATLLNHLGNHHALRGDMRAAVAAFEASQEAARTAGLAGRSQLWLVNLAAVYTWSGNTDGGMQIALRLDRAGFASTDGTIAGGLPLLVRGQAELYAGELAGAERHLVACLPLVAAHGMHSHQLLGLVWLGLTALAQDKPDEAAARAEEARALALNPSLGNIRFFIPEILAWAALAGGDEQTAEEHAAAVARGSLQLDNFGAMARCLDLSAEIEHRRGAADRAAILLGASDEAREALGHVRAPHERRAAEQLAGALRRDLGASRHAELRDEGGALALRDAVELALGSRERAPTG